MASNEVHITPDKFSTINVENDTSLKDFQIYIKTVSAEQKTILEAVRNTLIEFFKKEKFKETTEEQQAILATQLCKNIIDNVSSAIKKPDISNIDVGPVSKIVLPDSEGKNLEKYVKTEFDKIKESEEIKNAIDDITFSPEELDSFKALVLEKIEKIVSEESEKYDRKLKNDTLNSNEGAYEKTAVLGIYQRHRNKFVNDLVRNTINFNIIEKQVLTKIHEKITNSILPINSTIEQMSNKLIAGGSQLYMLESALKRKNKSFSKNMTFFEMFSYFDKKLLRLPSIIRKRIKEWKDKTLLSIKNAFDRFLPVTEFLFVIKLSSAIVKFGVEIFKTLKKFTNWIFKSTSFIYRNTVGLLINVLKKTTVFTFSSKLFKSFFKSWLGAYIIGYAAGFIYWNIKRLLPNIKEWYSKFSERIDPIRKKLENIEKTLESVALRSFFTIHDVKKQIEAYYSEGEGANEEKTILGALDNVEENLRDSNGRKIFSKGNNGLFDQINKACRWIQKNFVPSKLTKLIRSYAVNIGTDVLLSWWGAELGAAAGMVIAGPFGAIVGGTIGAFAGPEIKRWFPHEATKFKTGETEYQQYLRNTFGRITSFSSADIMLHDADISEDYDLRSDLGFLTNIVQRQLSNLDKPIQMSEIEQKRFEQFGFKLNKNGRLPEELKPLAFLENLSKQSIIDEINDVTDLLFEFSSTFGKTHDDQTNFSSEELSKAARTTMLALNESGTEKISNIINGDRNVLVHRLYRAYILYSMLPYIKTIGGEEFLKIYNELTYPKKERSISDYNSSLPVKLNAETMANLIMILRESQRKDIKNDSILGKLPSRLVDIIDVSNKFIHNEADRRFLNEEIIDKQQQEISKWQNPFGGIDPISGRLINLNQSLLDHDYLGLDSNTLQNKAKLDFKNVLAHIERTNTEENRKNSKYVDKLNGALVLLRSVLMDIDNIESDEKIILMNKITRIVGDSYQQPALMDSGQTQPAF